MRTFKRSSITPVLALTTVVALAAAACGDDSGADPGTDVAAEDSGQQAEPEPAPENGGEVAAVGADSELGRILVDSNGMTLYAFANDADGQSSCSGTCADAWPPLTVGPDWDVGPELDSAIFNTYTRDDGGNQLVVGSWPLYTFSEDATPGDLKGQGSGGVWFVVSAEDGSLIRDEVDGGGDSYDDSGDDPTGDADADVQVGETDLGEVLTDAEGMTLYGFTNDPAATPTCAGDCAATWPPLTLEGEPGLVEGLDPSLFSIVDGADGGTQVVAGDWPLYRFSGDSAPGDVNGQGSGGVWFAVGPDGTLLQ